MPVVYLSVLTGAAWYATIVRRARATGPPTMRFALLVPAHDEEPVISETLEAITRLDYPSDRVAVHVVADHCHDRTAELAAAAGADVHVRDHGEPGKGPALQWTLDHLLSDSGSNPDVVAIVDADTLVDTGFLRGLTRAFAAGHQVVQGQYRVRDPGSSPGAGLRAGALALRHHLRPLGRTTIGGSCGLYGNGMAFRSEILEHRTWSDHLTEDIELQMELLLDGTLVAYAPDAIVEAEMPDSIAGARTQNERWERGRIELARRYVPQLARLAIRDRRRRIAAIDGLLDHLVPPLSVLVAATGTVALAGSAASLLGVRGGRRCWALVGALSAHVASGFVLARMPWSVYRALAHAPAMVWWKLRLWIRMLRRPGEEGWTRTARVGRPERPS